MLPAEQGRKTMLQIDKNQTGAEVEVPLGEQIELRLGENPTTGYRWYVRSSIEPVLSILEDTFEPSSRGVGAGGIRCWRLRGVREGTARLELEHRRSWEQQAVDVFTLSIRVTANRTSVSR
jgi:inhibitor of cysteine peptidase